MSNVQFEGDNFNFKPHSTQSRESRMISLVIKTFGFRDEKTAQKALLVFSFIGLITAFFLGFGVMGQSSGKVVRSPIDNFSEDQKLKLPKGMLEAYERSRSLKK